MLSCKAQDNTPFGGCKIALNLLVLKLLKKVKRPRMFAIPLKQRWILIGTRVQELHFYFIVDGYDL